MDCNIIQVKELNYSYLDGTKALNEINLEIARGKTTAILGGNGAGKSTLFLNFNGVLKPSTGQIFYNNNPIDYSRKGLMDIRKSVGLVFQDPDSQLFSASVYQDVSFGAVNLKLPKEEVKRRVETALIRTGIMDIKDKPTHFLSYGQKKRVAIAGVLVMEPEVLILDEPTAGLDPMGVGDIMRLLRETQEQLGLTVIISTHDIDIVPLYSDYIYVMDKGNIVLKGTPKEVFAEANKLRSIHLRLPRIAHLMEILQKKDGFNFNTNSTGTISCARKTLKKWREDTAEY